MVQPRVLTVTLAAWTGLVGSTARAAPIQEVEHDIDVALHEEHATLVVHRKVSTIHVDDVEAHFRIGGTTPLAATGLRTLATNGTWYGADLRPTQDAVETYWKLTGSKKVTPERELENRYVAATPKDPALMLWTVAGLELFVFPVTEGVPKEVEYTLQVPYAYENGAYVLRVPQGDADELPPMVHLAKVPRAVTVSADDAVVTEGSRFAPTTTDPLEIVLRPDAHPALEVSLAALDVGGRHLGRVDIEVGLELGPDPTGTHAVVVLDRSRSLGDDSIVATKRAALAYLDALADVPGTRVEVVHFDRAVVATHGAWVVPSVARAALDATDPTLANGSDLLGALATARTRLATAPPGVARRVVVLSDTKLAPDDEAKVQAAFASVGALVHLADVIGARYTSLEVAADHRLAKTVRATGGATWSATVDSVDGDDTQQLSEWVRPQRIRELTVAVDGADLSDFAWDQAVGEGILDVRVFDTAPKRATAAGWLWGSPISVRARRSRAADARWARYAAAYGSEDLTDDEIVALGRRTGAVTPQTALLALEPNAQPGEALPSTTAAGRFRVVSCRLGGAGGTGGFGRYALDFDEADLVRTETEAVIAACGATDHAVEVELTTTYAEVVAVDRVEVADDTKDAASCIRQGLWAIEFPPGRDVIVRHLVTHAP